MLRLPALLALTTLAAAFCAAPVSAQRRGPRASAVPPTTTSAEPTPAEAPPPALDDAAARQHFEAGRAYFQRAQYEQAASEFAESYRLSARPALLVNLSRAEEGAGRLEPAIEALRRWESTAAADDPERPAMTERMGRLESARARAQATATPPPRAAEIPTATQPESGLTGTQVIGIVVLSGGAAVGVGALISGLMAGSAHANLEETCDASGACPASSVGDIDGGESLALVSTVLLGVALAAGATGLILLLTGGRGDSESAPVGSARLTPGPGQLGAGFAWSF